MFNQFPKRDRYFVTKLYVVLNFARILSLPLQGVNSIMAINDHISQIHVLIEYFEGLENSDRH
jgi:hypothetical protein